MFLHQEFLGLVHLQEGAVARALPQGDLYYVLAVHAGAAFLLPFLGLTIELFIFPDSDNLEFLPVRQAWSRIYLHIWVR